MKKFFILTIFSLLFYGCTTIDMLFHPEQYQKKSSPQRITEIVYDTVRIYNASGEIQTAVSGLPQRRITFTQIGQSYKLRQGELVEFVFDGVDFGKATFDITTDLETNEITISLVHRDTSKIYLSSKCQTIRRMDTGTLASIEIAPNLKPEQVVITPYFNEDCEKVGYEVRYGSEERGCKYAAQAVLKRFYDCTKNISKSTTKKTKSPCINSKFGLPCN